MTEPAIKSRERIEQDLLKMASMAQEIMKSAIQALREQNVDLALRVIEQDDQIDNMQIVIEEEIERAALDAHGFTLDLRRDFSTIKIVNDMERIGDYANNIAEVVLELKNEKYMKPLVHIPQLASLALSMLDTVIKAFIKKDIDLAEAVCRKDEEADNLYDAICDELIKLIGNESNPQKAYQASRFLLIAEWLERTADHTTNIGEETIYMMTGKRVRY